MGDAPLSVEIPCWQGGQFSRRTTIRALPTVPGNFVQSKFFTDGYTLLRNDQVPSRIFFDMRLGPLHPRLM